MKIMLTLVVEIEAEHVFDGIEEMKTAATSLGRLVSLVADGLPPSINLT